jgi:hypothetical protein
VSRTGERHRRRRRECVCDLPLASRFERSLPSVRARVARFQGARSPGTFRRERKSAATAPSEKICSRPGTARRKRREGPRRLARGRTCCGRHSRRLCASCVRVMRRELVPERRFPLYFSSREWRLRNDAFSPELGPLAFRSVGQPEKTRPSAGTSRMPHTNDIYHSCSDRGRCVYKSHGLVCLITSSM